MRQKQTAELKIEDVVAALQEMRSKLEIKPEVEDRILPPAKIQDKWDASFKIAVTLLVFPFYLVTWLHKRVDELSGLSKRQLVKRPPGTRLLQIADFLSSPTNVEQVFEPLVADWQKEYFDALQQGRTLKARWISVRYYWRSILALGLSKVFSLLRSFTSARK